MICTCVLFLCVGSCRAFRDAGEGLVRTRLLELELKLLRAENDLVSDRLGAWIEKVLRASM